MTGAVTGIDMGVASFLTTSEGRHVPNPRHLKASATKLAAAQQDLARKKRGSNRRKKAVSRVAALHGTVRGNVWTTPTRPPCASSKTMTSSVTKPYRLTT